MTTVRKGQSMKKNTADQNRQQRIIEIADQVYRYIQKKDVTLRELTTIVYRVKRTAEVNTKV